MMAAVAAARLKGYSVEVISEPEDDNFMTEKTPEEQLRATQLEASGGVAGTNEASQENFIQDPIESAAVVSETVALEDTESPQEDGSSVSLSEQSSVLLESFKEKKSVFMDTKLELPSKEPWGEILGEEGLELMRAKGAEWTKEAREQRFGIRNSDGVEVPGAREEVESYTEFTQNLIDQGILNTFQKESKYMDGKAQGGVGQELKDYVKEQYGIAYKYPDAISITLDEEGNPKDVNPYPQSPLPTQYTQDTIITELIEKARRKENQARADMQVKEGTIIALSPSEEIKTEMGLTISNLTTVQQELVAISQELQEI